MDRIKEALIRYAREHGLQQVFGTDCQATVTHKVELKIPTRTHQPDEHEQMPALLRQSPH